MEAIHDVEFSLIHQDPDYLEFTVSYKIEYNLWSFEGIGWLRGSVPHYYLRSLHLNKWPAGKHYNNKAGLVTRQQSFKFESPLVDRLVMSKLEQLLGKPMKL